ncbi:phage tail assembly protein [Clostridium botulinum]|nr:phage tail assembly protein [Clostridium botulinum]MBO0555671.1 phage tail assembly protein [Clostridium botulinum]
MSKLQLSKEVEINGELTKEIEYDFEDLNGDVMEVAIKELQKSGYVPSVQETDVLLHAHIFAQASQLDYSDVKRLGIRDYMKATSLVRNFFFEGLADLQEENSSEQ